MQIDYKFEAMIPRPTHCLPKVIDLSRNERFSTRGIKGPISDWHTDMVKTSVNTNLNEAIRNEKNRCTQLRQWRRNLLQWSMCSSELGAWRWPWYGLGIDKTSTRRWSLNHQCRQRVKGWSKAEEKFESYPKFKNYFTVPPRRATRLSWRHEPSVNHRGSQRRGKERRGEGKERLGWQGGGEESTLKKSERTTRR